MRLLLTRPEADAQRTAAALRALGHEAIIAPLLSIAVTADAEIGSGPWAAILITSANAAHAIATHTAVRQFQALPVFTVGQRSAQAMAAAGFADVSSAEGGVAELAHLAAARVKPGASLLYLAGEDRSGDLAGDLRARGFAVQTASHLSRRGCRNACRASQPKPWQAASTACCISRAAAPRPMSEQRAAPTCSRRRPKACPVLHFSPGGRAAVARRRDRHPGRRRAVRGRIDRAYRRGMMCCRHLCPVLCPERLGRFDGLDNLALGIR